MLMHLNMRNLFMEMCLGWPAERMKLVLHIMYDRLDRACSATSNHSSAQDMAFMYLTHESKYVDWVKDSANEALRREQTNDALNYDRKLLELKNGLDTANNKVVGFDRMSTEMAEMRAEMV